MKTPVLITLAATLVTVAGIIAVIVITGHDPSAYLVALSGMVPMLGALFTVNGIAKKTDTIQSNTNGTLTSLRGENAALSAALHDALGKLPPETAATVPAPIVAPLPLATADSAPALDTTL